MSADDHDVSEVAAAGGLGDGAASFAMVEREQRSKAGFRSGHGARDRVQCVPP